MSKVQNNQLHVWLLVFAVLPLLNVSGCALFAKSALGKMGVEIPSLVHEEPDDELQMETEPLVSNKTKTAQGVPNYGEKQLVRAQVAGGYGYIEPLRPLSEEDLLAPLNLESLPAFEDPHLSYPGNTNDTPPAWNPQDVGYSLADADRRAEEAEREKKYRETLKNAEKNKSDEKPWLEPLPHPYGPFAYRTESQTRGFGGDVSNIQQVAFDPITQKAPDEPDLFNWEKEEEKSFDWSMFDPVNFATKVRDWMGMGPDEKKAAAYMESGYKLIREGQFKDAAKNKEAGKLFEKAAARWPDSVLEEDALFLAGESYFFAENYYPASKNYIKLISKHRGSKYVDTSVRRLFRIARYWEVRHRNGVSFVNTNDKTRPTLDTFNNAKKVYEAIYTNDPTGPRGDMAIMALAGAYMALGKNQGDSHYSNAAELYAALPEINARSEYLMEARKLELIARKKAYVGAQYDSKSLDEAIKLAEITDKLYGSSLASEDRNAFLELKESLTEEKAERLWEVGQYYEKKKQYSSARYNYEKLMKEYPTSPRFSQAEKQFVKIQNLEDMDDNVKRIQRFFRIR